MKLAKVVSNVRRGHKQSVIDLLSLSSYHSVAPNARFVIYGKDPAAARALGKSSAMALLPADVGLLLIGSSLILDFSTRPFDGIAFERMDQLAEQLVTHLPAVKPSAAAGAGVS